MKTLEIFIANDGTRFDNKEKCQKYDALILTINKLLNKLDKRPENFYNTGYIQHEEFVFNQIKEKIIDIACEITGCQSRGGILGRWICDSDNRILSKAWYRIMCTDKYYREWDQPYFAVNPREGFLKRLN